MKGNSGTTARIQPAADETDDTALRARAADLDAVRRCLAGDRGAYGELVSRWQDRIYAVIFRMTGDAHLSKDLAQDTFLRAWSSLRSFEGGAAFGTWLHSIAINQVRSDLRRRSAQKRGAPVSLDAAGGRDDDGGRALDPAGDAPAPSASMEERERSSLLHRAIAALDPEFREVLVLREFQDLPYEDIADIVGVPVGTVRSRLFRARNELREKLEGKL